MLHPVAGRRFPRYRLRISARVARSEMIARFLRVLLGFWTYGSVERRAIARFPTRLGVSILEGS